jgi:hypothetical protein
MTLTDATIALLLAARIHGTDASDQAMARRCAKLLPRNKRGLIYKVVGSWKPRILVMLLAQELELRRLKTR